MPSYPCRHPTCCVYVRGRGDYCETHEAMGRQARAERDRFYDRHRRDPCARAFYDSTAWRRARETKLASNPVCEWCERAGANTVHHRVPLKRCTPAQRLEQRNLQSLCAPCHNIEESEATNAA